MKTIILLFSLALPFMLHAQSTEQGNRHLYYERYQSAEQNFHQALAQDPENTDAWFGLTKAYLGEGKHRKAIDSIRLSPPSIQDEPYYHVAYGSLMLAMNKKDSAAIHFKNALEKTKEKNAGVLSAIARAHVESMNGDGQYAVDLLNKAIKRDKHNPELYVLLGDAYRKLSNGSEAYTSYKKALEENDKYPLAYHKLGEIFLGQKNSELYLEYFNKAIGTDPDYAPSIYKLYAYYFFHDPAKAMAYYKSYMANSDPTIQNEYDLADLYYLNKDYSKALDKAKKIAASETVVKPRLYKLMTYSYAGAKDTTQAITYMRQYLSTENDTNIIAKDYELMADLFAATPDKDSATTYYAKAVMVEKDSAALTGYYKKLADLSAEQKNYATQAQWLSKYYQANKASTNLDLFNWGLAHYRAEEYEKADSVFGMYVAKYPEQSFGYYWQAKSVALRDKDMSEGLAVPYYHKLIETLQKDTSDVNFRKWMVEAYGYLAAYEANNQKDYAEAIDYFEKLLEVDPENSDAKKYIAILEKSAPNEGGK